MTKSIEPHFLNNFGDKKKTKILIIRSRMIGDIILSTPIIFALKYGFKNSYIGYVVEEPYAALVDELKEIDRLHIFNKKKIFKLIYEIRKEKYDILIDLHSIPKTAWISRLSGAKFTIGFDYKDRYFLYSQTIKPPPQFSKHSVETMMLLPNLLGLFTHPGRVIMRSSQAKENIDKIITQKFMNKKIVVIHVAPSNNFKKWSSENYAILSNKILKMGLTPVFVGGKSDEIFIEEIKKIAKTDVNSLAGVIDLKELREFISRSILYIGVDSGPAHVAATTDVPMIILYGPTSPKTFIPYRNNIDYIYSNLTCSPCRQKECLYGDYRCMNISTNKVIEKMGKYIPTIHHT